MMIELSKIRNNPYRDEKLDPIDEDKLVDSIGSMGFWGGIAVRKATGGYELVFGHHRIAALRKVIKNVSDTESKQYDELSPFYNMEKADIKIVTYDDDKMILGMTIENSTQRGGESGGNIDAVAAIIRRIGYLLLTKSDEELRLLRNSEGSKLFHDAAKVKKARTLYKAGEGVGSPLILKYAGGALKRDDIVSALKWLKSGGYMAAICDMVSNTIAAEAEAAEAEAKRIKQKEKKKKAEALAKKLAEAEVESESIEIDDEKTVDIGVNAVLSRTSHSDAFLDVVNTPDGRKYLPSEMHVAMAEKILSTHAEEEMKKDGTEKHMSARYVRDSVVRVLHDAMGVDRKAKKAALVRDLNQQADKALKDFKRDIGKSAQHVSDLMDALDHGARLDSNEQYKATTFFTAHIKPFLTQLEELEYLLKETNQVVSNQ